MIKGYRKIIMVAIVGAITAVLPEITGHPVTDNQVTVLQALIMAAFGGNAIEHLVEGFKNANRVRNSGGAVHSVRAVSHTEQAPAVDRH